VIHFWALAFVAQEPEAAEMPGESSRRSALCAGKFSFAGVSIEEGFLGEKRASE
jgi:hypothetical protein